MDPKCKIPVGQAMPLDSTSYRQPTPDWPDGRSGVGRPQGKFSISVIEIENFVSSMG